MVFSSSSFSPLAALVLATIPNFYYMSPILNTGGYSIVANVLTASAASSICAINFSVGPDALLTAQMRFTSGTVDLRIANRFKTNTSPNATYYWAGVTGANFRIGKTVDGVFTTLASVAFSLTVNTWATITLEVVGESIEATIDAGGGVTTLTATDGDIDDGGTHFTRSGPTNTCASECRAASVARAA